MNRINPEVIKLKEDIVAIRNKLSNVEEQIKEEEKVNLKLRADTENKLRQLETIDEAISAEVASFRLKQKRLQTEIAYFKDDSRETIDDLQYQLSQLRIELAGANVIEDENSKLHERIKQESKKSAQQKKIWQDELERIKLQNFDSRVKLEEVFRSTVKIFDKDSRLEAVKVMEVEAAQAEVDNRNFLNELRARALFCSKLSRKHEVQYAKLSKMKLIREVMTTGSTMQEKTLLRLDREREKVKTYFYEYFI
jgi:chromosome segregation ATPase